MIREFDTGATRNNDVEKLDPEGFLNPEVLHEFSKYMHNHRKQSDGRLRASDNWQKGIPVDVYMKSMTRHFMDLWSVNRGYKRFAPEDNHELDKKELLCALLFNVQGMLLEELKK